MSESDFQRIGPLYPKLGLNTSPEIVSARIEGLKKAYSKIDEFQLKTIIRCAIGQPPTSGLEGLIEIFSEEDPTTTLKNEDPELNLLVRGLVYQKILDDDAKTALTFLTASFGGIRNLIKYNDSLLELSIESVEKSQESFNHFPPQPTYRTKPKLVEEWTELENTTQGNNFSAGIPLLKTLMTKSINYSENAVRDLANQLSGILDHQKLLDEQMQIHWWIVGGQSQTERKPFSKLSTFEVAACGAFELGDLSKAHCGTSAPDALLRLVIESGRTDFASKKISDAIKTISIDLRKRVTEDLLSDEERASLAPIHLAMALSAEANDANDWHARFKRITGVSASKSIKPLDYAVQIYYEVLMLRSI